MTFTVDSCIIIALVNRFDLHHDKSEMLLLKRKDNMVILITIMTEAISTYIRKFNKASKDLIDVLNKTSKSTDFVELFDQKFKEMLSENKKKSIANFYEYVYSLIEAHIINKDFKQVANIMQDHSYDLATMIPERIDSLKKVDYTVYPDRTMIVDRELIESIISAAEFPKGADKISFLILCAYSKDKDLDYFTTDGEYYLRMIESLNLIKKDESFSTGLSPIYLTDSYIASLQ